MPPMSWQQSWHVDAIAFVADAILWRAAERPGDHWRSRERAFDETTGRFPEIGWRDLARLRIVLAHHYQGVDSEQFWTIAVGDVPMLVAHLSMIRRRTERIERLRRQAMPRVGAGASRVDRSEAGHETDPLGEDGTALEPARDLSDARRRRSPTRTIARRWASVETTSMTSPDSLALLV